jgi:translation initiation factor IF-2
VRAELGFGAALAPLGVPGCDPGPGMLAGRVPGRPVAPAPAGASWGHSPPASGHLCAPRPPSPSCPLGSPRAGGGNRRPRLDSASQAAAGSGGGAGRGGKQRTTRCVWASGARVSRSGSRGAPAGGGAAGRPSGWNPRPEAAGGLGGPRGPSGSDGRQERAAVGRACQSSRKAGPGARGRDRLASPAPGLGSLGDSASVPGDLAGPPGGAAGRAPSRRERLGLEIFRISAPTRRSQTKEALAFYPDSADCRLP